MTIPYTKSADATEFTYFDSVNSIEQMRGEDRRQPYIAGVIASLALPIIILAIWVNAAFALALLFPIFLPALLLMDWSEKREAGGKVHYGQLFWAEIKLQDYIKSNHHARLNKMPSGENVTYMADQEFIIPFIAKKIAEEDDKIIALVQVRTRVISGATELFIFGPVKHRAL